MSDDLVTVICCIYNSVGPVRQTLEALAACSEGGNVELVLVDNHSPDPAAREYIVEYEATHRHCRIVDPGKNLGCHGGWNYGLVHTHGQYVCKLDDDTVLLTRGWWQKMPAALAAVPECGFLSADIDAKQKNVYLRQMYNGYEFEVALTGVVGFSFVMFRRTDIARWGPMNVGAYRTASGTVVPEKAPRLYGGEEVYYAGAAKRECRFIAHFPAVKVHHLGNEERHPDYAMWKRAYGYHAWTDKDMETWIEKGEREQHYRRALQCEVHAQHPNDVLLIQWSTRLAQIGVRHDAALILGARDCTNNGVAKAACEAALAALFARTKNEGSCG